MKVFEKQEDCPLVEWWIWNHIALSSGEFEGVKELSEADLWQLKSHIDCRFEQLKNERKL